MSLFKQLFGFSKNKLTEDELIKLWNNSNKQTSDFISLVSNTSDDRKLSTIINEYIKINFNKISEIAELANFLRSIVNNKNNNEKYYWIISNYINQIEYFYTLFYNIGENYIKSKIIFSDSMKILSFLVKTIKETNLKAPQISFLRENIYSNYFNSANYLKAVK